MDDLIDRLVSHYGYDRGIEVLAELAGYEKMPPTIDEFLDDDYYAGQFLGPYLYPTWRGVLHEVFPHPLYSDKLEVACSGSIGTGKSSLCLAGMLYDLCRLLHLRNPHENFQLISSTQIVFAFMNTTVKLADSVLFRQFNDWINDSPFFRAQKAKVKDPRRDFLPHNIGLFSGSQGVHALGRAVISGILSELNFQGQHRKDQAYQSYVQVRRRMESRFMRGEGFLSPGRLWLDSSKSDETGFLEQHLKHLYDDPSAMVICKAVWEVLGPAGKVKYSGDTFPVFIGDSSRDPMILSGPGASINIPEALILPVPVEYMKSFEQDIYGALRDIAGVSTWSAHKYFPQSSALKKQMTGTNACPKEIVELDFNDDSRLIDFLDLSKLDKNFPYFIHFDLGLKQDRTGIAMTRSLGEVQIDRTSMTTLEQTVTQDLMFKTDLAIGVIPRPGKEVPIYKLKNWVISMMHAGFNIAGVSADGFQSANLLQDLSILGIENCEVISVDKYRDKYDLWKQATLEGRWFGPVHTLLEKEFLELLDLGRKIDHPSEEGTYTKSKPSKDIADAVAGSVAYCSQKTARTKVLTAMDAYLDVLKKQTDQQIRFEDQMFQYAQQQRRGFGRFGY